MHNQNAASACMGEERPIMEPRAFLKLLSSEWALLVEIFESSKTGPIDHSTLLQLIDANKRTDRDVYALLNLLLESGAIGQPLSGETLYQLGGLTETIVSHLLQEHRLGLSESIQAHIQRLDELSQRLLRGAMESDAHQILSAAKKLREHTQDIKHQISNNLFAIRNIVSGAKKSEIAKPLRQRYAEVIEAWDQYITPMGDMIDVGRAFDSTIDQSISRMDQAISHLESSGALMSEISNLRTSRQMLNDMRWHAVRNFQVARDVLRPLYEIARINSKVTRGCSIILDAFQKERQKELDPFPILPLYRQMRASFVSPTSALMSYYYGVKDVEDRPPPTITAPRDTERNSVVKALPLNIRAVLAHLRSDMPIEDLVGWIIRHYGEHSTGKLLDIVLSACSERSLAVQKNERARYTTSTHIIECPAMVVEISNEQ